jgi:hypothetical protein
MIAARSDFMRGFAWQRRATLLRVSVADEMHRTIEGRVRRQWEARPSSTSSMPAMASAHAFRTVRFLDQTQRRIGVLASQRSVCAVMNTDAMLISFFSFLAREMPSISPSSVMSTRASLGA